jgi:DNA-binding beta-propeller fold protein YncE
MSYLRSSLLVGLSALCATFVLSGGAIAKPLYTITKTIPLGSPERWDYLYFDAPTHRVYVSHSDHLDIVDGRTGAKIGEVDGFAGGTHGIAIVHSVGRGYTDDGRAGEAGSFDLKTFKPIKRIKAEDDADGMVYDPASGHVFVVDSDPGHLTVIDPKTDMAVATIDAGGKLEFAVVDGRGNLYVNGEGKREIVHVDTKTNEVKAHWAMPMCESPHGLAIDVKSHRLFSSCRNSTLVVLNTDDGKIVTTLPIGSGTDAAKFDAKHKRVFSSNFDGTLTVISEKSPNSYEVLGNVPTMMGARTMAVDPESGRLYVVAADMTVNKDAAPNDFRHRYNITPGSTKLLFLDPSD